MRLLGDGATPSYEAIRSLRRKRTPVLVLDREAIERRFEEFQKAISGATIFYALKANPHKGVVALLYQLGAGFEVSSEQELASLLRHNVSPQRIISSNPVKSISFIKAAYSAGMDLFAFDSYSELEKLSQFAPKSRVYVRLSVSNEGSQWPLSGKFGIEAEDAVELLVQVGERQLIPYGITFHVGSQCTDVAAWVEALDKSRVVWEAARSRGIELRMLNIGGGFPIAYIEPVPPLCQIAGALKEAIDGSFPEGVEVFLEPGRALVGEAGVLVTTVIGKAMRDGQGWLYLDAGVFQGMMESMGGIRYPMTTAKSGRASKWVLAGPSCDSFDVISTEVELVEPEIGDKVYIMSAGAYTTAYASQFNGFCIPKTYLI
jgi:ornithine decarboxylase